ncbi:hypothetical protein ACFY5F_23610 [Streptomyces sp. NPDC013161]|uniref:hypothetical protein n=1 Tax=Streptomyces sp. NPDC013161 TaxID=3364862 RepID=UPI0036BE32FD
MINTNPYGDGTALSTVSGQAARRISIHFRTRPTVVVTPRRPQPVFDLPAPSRPLISRDTS